MFPNSSCSRHWREDLAKPVDKSALLIYSKQRFARQYLTHTIKQCAQLLAARDVPTEDNYAAGLYLFDHFARCFIEFGAGKADVEELSYLFGKREGRK